MPGTSKVAVFNLALQHIGQRAVGSDTEQTVMAIACQRAWDPARREVLRECPWGFATVIESLAEVSGFTAPQTWVYAYQYPAKCLAMRKIFMPTEAVDSEAGAILPDPDPNTLSPNRFASQIRSTTGDRFREIFSPDTNAKLILSNTENAVAEYTYDVEDTTKYDATCVTLLGYRLAADIATPLTGDSAIAVNLIKIYNTRLSEAQRLNSYEDNTRSLGDGLTVDSR